MVETYPDGRSVLFAYFQKGFEPLPGEAVVRGEVARIDPDLFHVGSHFEGNLRREVHVGYQRQAASAVAQHRPYVPDMLHVLKRGHCDSDHLRPSLFEPQALLECGLFVVGMGVAHTLHHYIRTASYHHTLTYLHQGCLQSFHIHIRMLPF